MPNEYDVVVVGAGTGGYVAAIRAAQLGLTVAVVEKQKALGGTCLLWGCIPTKALLEHAHALKIVQQAKEWGVTIGEAVVSINMAQVQARKNKVVTGLTKGIEFLFKKNNVDWIKGTARLTGNGGVDVFAIENGKRGLACGYSKHAVLALEDRRQRVPHPLIVVDDEDGFRLMAHQNGLTRGEPAVLCQAVDTVASRSIRYKFC